MNHRVLNKAIAFARGKKVMTSIAVSDAKSKDVSEYRRKYGKKAIYKKNGVEYVKPFIRVQAKTSMEL
jgi:hypothetical protein